MDFKRVKIICADPTRNVVVVPPIKAAKKMIPASLPDPLSDCDNPEDLRTLYNDGDGGGYKQWSLWRPAGDDMTVIIAFGHVGNKLRRMKKVFRSASRASFYISQKYRAKRREGYRENK
jgi:predicted DNA-binding WGR domain protein